MSSRPRALVTGAGIRLGRAMAVALAQDGFDLVLHYRSSQNQVQVTAQMCAAHGASSQIVQGDLSQVEACCSVALTAGAVDVLVNSAALYEAVPIQDITPQQWEQMLAVNTRAPFFLTQALLPGLRASKRPGGGCVVMLGDIGGQRPSPGVHALQRLQGRRPDAHRGFGFGVGTDGPCQRHKPRDCTGP